MKSERHYIYGFILLLSLGFFGWYTVEQSMHQRIVPYTLDLPDMIIENVLAMQFDEEGQLKNKLTSPHLVHYEKDNTSYLTKPRITITQGDKTPVMLRAQHGKTVQGVKQITLWKNVYLHQAAGENNPDNKLKTSELIYTPETQLAQSSKTVTIQQGQSKMQSHGMQAYLRNGHIEFQSQARGTYHKPKKHS